MLLQLIVRQRKNVGCPSWVSKTLSGGKFDMFFLEELINVKICLKIYQSLGYDGLPSNVLTSKFLELNLGWCFPKIQKKIKFYNKAMTILSWTKIIQRKSSPDKEKVQSFGKFLFKWKKLTFLGNSWNFTSLIFLSGQSITASSVDFEEDGIFLWISLYWLSKSNWKTSVYCKTIRYNVSIII